MVNKKLCKRCMFRGERAPHGVHCCYCLVTGRCRTTQPGTDLEDVCPMFCAGPAVMARQRLPESLMDYGEGKILRCAQDDKGSAPADRKKAPNKKKKTPARTAARDILSDHFRVLYMAGKNDHEIAEITGSYPLRVLRWRKLHRLPANDKTGRKKTRKEGGNDPQGDQM